MSAFRLYNEQERLRAVLLVCLELPTAHLHTLRFLLNMLAAVVSQPGSKMTPSNLAAILTPNILRPGDENPRTMERAATTSEEELANHASCCGVVELLIVHHAVVGMVPREISSKASRQEVARAKARYLKATNTSHGFWCVRVLLFNIQCLCFFFCFLFQLLWRWRSSSGGGGHSQRLASRRRLEPHRPARSSLVQLHVTGYT